MTHTPFEFTPDNAAKIPGILARYPADHAQSAVMPLLDLAQSQQGGWLPQGAIETVATLLNMPVIRVQEVASFYSMYNLQPVGRTVIQVCTTTPCWLRGSDDVVNMCTQKLGITLGETKGNITLKEVQCLGACVAAPVAQINDTYHEGLTPDSTAALIDGLLAHGKDTL